MTPTNKQFESNNILLTVDIEDWFQVENLKAYIPFDEWRNQELRVEKNTYSLLDLFAKSGVKATFFVLGWVAERLPNLVREIHSQAHEVASHGFLHRLCSQQSTNDLKEDLLSSKKLLEDIMGSPVYGYRAPSFSIDDNILKIIGECGYLYDSSFNSFGVNKRYGRIDLTGKIKKGIAFQIADDLYELPISNLHLGKHVFPWGGGGYFRTIPLPLFLLGVRYILREKNTYLFYMHPWEIDLEQPMIKDASNLIKFRHYFNLNKTISKLSKFINKFQGSQFTTCHQYLNSLRKIV